MCFDHSDPDPVLRGNQAPDDVPPVRHVGGRDVEVQVPADEVIHALALKHQGTSVNRMIHVLFPR